MASSSTSNLSSFKPEDPSTYPFNIPPSAVAKTHKGLITLPIRFGTSEAAKASPIYHYTFVKPHDPEYTPLINAHPNINGRSLFLSSIPFDSTAHHFRALFTAIGGGRVETVIFSDEPLPPRQYSFEENQLIKNRKRKRGGAASIPQATAETAPWPALWNRKLHAPGTTAVVVFVDQAACELSLKAVQANSTDNPREDYFWGSGIGKGNDIPELGLSRYEDHLERMFPDPDLLQKFVDDSLEAYDARLKAEEEERRRKANEPDEDGFVTVVRSTKPRLPPSAEEIAERKKKEDEKAKKGVYKDFYRFQQREVKKEQAQKLLSQFEEAKRKVREQKRRGKS
ncbi:hypothetical protein ABW19_dt0204379 [Dactylella cylindrospora]|nr:hypothetical protein ABW19_dt0204379 [Dactylella cylindrospora]